uniref:Reverse transcriptase domain-containing protein n=1 Tax=Strongyloides papillosus TaxID=174720 RepID=A0A0N5C528_STREA
MMEKNSVVIKHIISRYSKTFALWCLDNIYLSGPDFNSLDNCLTYFVNLTENFVYSINLRKSVTIPKYRLNHLEHAIRYADEACDTVSAAFISRAIPYIYTMLWKYFTSSSFK